MSKTRPKARNRDLVVQELKGELLIYDLRTNKAHCLNSTSALIWGMCDGSASVEDITARVGSKTHQKATDDLIWLALDQFKEDGLLADGAEAGVDVGGISRRDLIRKAGLASMVALPVIASITAPLAANAASTCGAPCVAGVACPQNCSLCLATCVGAPGTCLAGTTCNAQGTCTGTGVCSEGGVPCPGPNGTPCGAAGTCSFVGICSVGGTPCTSGGAPCFGMVPCSPTGICTPNVT